MTDSDLELFYKSVITVKNDSPRLILFTSKCTLAIIFELLGLEKVVRADINLNVTQRSPTVDLFDRPYVIFMLLAFCCNPASILHCL